MSTTAGYHKRRLNAIANGRWHAWVDPAPVAEHVRQLLAQGWPLAGIRRQAGVPSSTLSALMGVHGGPPSARIRPHTAARILAVTVPDLAAAAGLVIADGTRRRLQALAVNGWPLETIANRIGRNAPSLRRIAKGQRQHCHTDTARDVAAVFDELWDQQAPESQYTASTRRAAAELGWLPALAWDDIDDPNESPDQRAVLRTPGNVMRDRLAELDEQIGELTERGWPADRVAERLGVSIRTVERHRARQHQHQAAAS